MTEQSLAEHYLACVRKDFASIKSLGDKALSQLDELHLQSVPDPQSNSIAVIVKHMSGNMLSRWTDFLTTDGEKPGRNRDEEFVDDIASKEHLLELWELGWKAVMGALESLRPEDVLATVTIRGEPHSVMQAVQRQISHYGYHTGQIVYVAKMLKSSDWQTLSIPRGGSAAFNERMQERR